MAYKAIIDNVNRQQWEECAAGFADYSIYQTWPYQQLRCEMAGQEISRAVVENGRGQVATMCQVRIKHIRPLGLKIGYVQWGPLVRAMDGTLRCSAEALRALWEAYIGRQVNVLRVVPGICADEQGKLFTEMLRASRFECVRAVLPYRTLMLQLDGGEEAIRKKLHKSFRRDLKKAQKQGIEIRQGCDNRFCQILEHLYLASQKRKGFKGLDPQEFIRPQLMLSAAEKMNIIVAYCDGEPVAAHLASSLGDTAIVLLVANSEKGLSSGSSYLVWWQGAVEAWKAGMKTYDQGGIDPENNPAVYHFKSKMGGTEQIYLGAYEVCSGPVVKGMWHSCEKLYRFAKK
jgi:hypothetical protein